MEVALLDEERLLPGARDEAQRLLDEGAAFVLLRVEPEGERALARAARAYMARWDARFVHRQTWYAPMARVASRAPLPGPRLADAAPLLADAIGRGERVEAVAAPGVASALARDLDAWVRAWRAEGRAWGRAAASDARMRPFLPAVDRRGWWRHNVRQMPRRAIEVAEAARGPKPLHGLLHATREAAFTGGCVAGFRFPSAS